MTEARTFAAETRLLFRVALAILTVTVLIGIFNGFHFIQLSRAVLLTHVHAGTLGWITLVATVDFLSVSRVDFLRLSLQGHVHAGRVWRPASGERTLAGYVRRRLLA